MVYSDITTLTTSSICMILSNKIQQKLILYFIDTHNVQIPKTLLN